MLRRLQSASSATVTKTPRVAKPSAGLRRNATAALGAFAAVLVVAFAAGCEPEVGSPCGPPELVDERVVQEPGQNDLVRDLGFEACRSQGLCGSVDGSRPFCTKTCETDLDCGAEGFTCGRLISFGALACEDWTPESDCVQEDGTPSERPTLYCQAPREVIEKRDCDWGRAKDPAICESLAEQDQGEAE